MSSSIAQKQQQQKQQQQQQHLDSIRDRIHGMRQQEDSVYRYSNNFREDGGSSKRNDGHCLNATWREKIVHWSYNVVDHFHMRREVVAISLDFFDRYLATQGNRCNGNLALLTSLTTLHMAIKVHDDQDGFVPGKKKKKKIRIQTLAGLSRGQFGPSHMEEMEWKILRALSWRLHPPTAASFAVHLLCLLPDPSTSPHRELLELTNYLTELAVCDASFVPLRNSSVALAALLQVLYDDQNAMIPLRCFSRESRDSFLQAIRHHTGLDPNHPEVLEARDRMKLFSFAMDDTQDNEQVVLVVQDNNHNNNQASSSWGASAAAGGGGGPAIIVDDTVSLSDSSNDEDSKGNYCYSPSPTKKGSSIQRIISASPMTTNNNRRTTASTTSHHRVGIL